MNNNTKSFALKRSFSPYLALTIILLGIMVLQAFVSIKIQSWKPLISTGVVWLFFAAMAFIGTRYRVILNNDKVVRKAFGKPDAIISLNEITAVKNEVSDLSTLVKLQRPLRRIAIYGKNREVIDISLKHFVAKDIDGLIDEIRTQRPDLIIESKGTEVIKPIP